MAGWDRTKAMAAAEAMALTGNNVVLAHYWLSLWSGDTPPTRGQFHPARVKDLLPGIVLVDVQDGATCRLSGTAIDLACGRAMQGANLLDFAAGASRQTRHARLQTIVGGGVSVSRRRFETSPISSIVVESVQLPFGGVSETGARQYIAHANWRPDGSYTADAEKYDVGFPDEYVEIPIR